MKIDNIDDLLVINVPVAQGNPKPTGVLRDRAFYGENCTRKILVGTKALEKDIPPEITEAAAHGKGSSRTDTIILKGKAAYEFLLRFLCGLESANIGEDHVVHEFRRNWANYQKRADKLSGIPVFIDALLHDTKAIRDNIMHRYKELTLCETAKDLVQFKAGQSALVIATDETTAEQMVRALGKDNQTSAKTIYVTVSDSAPEKMAEKFRVLQDQKKLSADINCVTLDDAMAISRKQNHVFVCLGRRHAEDDARLLDGLAGCPNVVTLIKGGALAPDSPWGTFRAPNYISPIQVQEHGQKKDAEGKHILMQTGRACSIIATAREKKIKPIEALVVEHINKSDKEIERIMAFMPRYPDSPPKDSKKTPSKAARR
jgi:hypothetical protein